MDAVPQQYSIACQKTLTVYNIHLQKPGKYHRPKLQVSCPFMYNENVFSYRQVWLNVGVVLLLQYGLKKRHGLGA